MKQPYTLAIQNEDGETLETINLGELGDMEVYYLAETLRNQHGE